MKRETIIISLISLLILNIFLITAQPQIPTTADIDPATGLPKSLNKLQEIGGELSQEEKRKEYLKQEWTKILAENKILSPILFYTNKAFTFFNPFWKLIFGIEFSWSWLFILTLIIWTFIIVIIYHPLKLLNLSSLISLIISIVTSSLLGFFKIIEKILNLLIPLLTNIWFTLIFIVILIVISIAYTQFFRQLKQKQEKSQEELNREQLKRDVRISGAFTKGITEGLK